MIENLSLLTKKEVIAFNKMQFKKKLFTLMFVSIIILLFGAFVIWVNANVFTLIVGIILCVLAVAIIPVTYFLQTIRTKKEVEYLLNHSNNKGYIVKCVFNENNFCYETFVEEILQSKTDLQYENIFAIKEDEKYVYIYLNSKQALVLNKNGFTNATFEDFKIHIVKILKNIY